MAALHELWQRDSRDRPPSPLPTMPRPARGASPPTRPGRRRAAGDVRRALGRAAGRPGVRRLALPRGGAPERRDGGRAVLPGGQYAAPDEPGGGTLGGPDRGGAAAPARGPETPPGVSRP